MNRKREPKSDCSTMVACVRNRPAEPFPRKSIPVTVPALTDDEKGRAYAKTLLSPEVAAYRVVAMSQTSEVAEQIDVPTLLEALRADAAAVQGGDLTRAEAMLMSQASALQSIFARMTERGLLQAHMSNLEGFMRVALRAQAQCRTTLETLAALKNPAPTLFARQANIAHGPQQVNNAPATDGARAEKFDNQRNKVLEQGDGERLDTGEESAAGGVDQAVEAVGVVIGAKNQGR